MSYIDGDNLTIKECCGCNSALWRRLQCGPGLHDSTQTVHHIYSCRAYSCMLPEVSLTCHTRKCNTERLKKYLCMLVEVKYADEQNAGHLRDILSTERAMKAFILCYTSWTTLFEVDKEKETEADLTPHYVVRKSKRWW